MIRSVLLFAIVSLGFCHQELSDIYKAYKASKGISHKPSYRDVVLPSNTDTASKDLFFPPLPGQTPVDYHPQLRKPMSEDEPLTYYSWHIHVYFFHEDENVTARSLALRDEFISTFSIETCSDDCFMGGPFDTCTKGMCVWDPFYGVDGPHPYGQWGVYLPNELLAQTVAWMTANHGEFEVLFHPNTGYMVGDHDPSKRALWIKQQVPLDLDFLIWLQCEWFTCSDEVTLAQVSY
mmetsp:Transcript_22853/g.33381  ORF Transcript_22853/g.33381 Transcript_22853/m.33381 type:complete len:235 (+) Transcript_22853:67-771(+)|eukprot:CAMPEP_0185023940 /NCGR_PEP_ID=MMETSP1103-20130426/6655_1 /TAXON_ID=36769 /ORGANISM="Paraphysomonas bandaiensis, Strain Caron Lab Isolate" /LENGTH=234 /DNA_ID=CAMNT_0027556743 /DNA_START=44 /DNA_END=748 /DNA_ORIENTATION=+